MLTQNDSTSYYSYQPQPGMEVDDNSSANGSYAQPSHFAGYDVALQPAQVVYFNQQNPYYEAPLPDQKYQVQIADPSYQTSMQSQLHWAPISDQTYQVQIADPSYQTSMQSQLHWAPISDQTYQVQIPDPSYQTSMQSQLHWAPISDQTYQVQIPDPSYQTSMQDQLYWAPPSAQSYQNEMRALTCQSSLPIQHYHVSIPKQLHGRVILIDPQHQRVILIDPQHQMEPEVQKTYTPPKPPPEPVSTQPKAVNIHQQQRFQVKVKQTDSFSIKNGQAHSLIKKKSVQIRKAVS